VPPALAFDSANVLSSSIVVPPLYELPAFVSTTVPPPVMSRLPEPVIALVTLTTVPEAAEIVVETTVLLSTCGTVPFSSVNEP